MSDEQKAPDKENVKKAGRLLSQWLRQIAKEKTEFAKGEDSNGEDRMVTKAEAIARLIWKKALGYSEKQKNSKGVEVTENHPPDRAMINMIFDRAEGRAPVSTDVGKKKQSIADKVSEQGAKRIEKAGKIDATDRTESKT